MEINLIWDGGMKFHSLINGHTVIVDADETVGGSDQGPRPKPLMLVALAGCTGMDVVSLLKKMKVNYDSLQINIMAELTEEHPKIFKNVHIVYEFSGQDIDKDKVKKAVDLSQEKYCGVSAMFRHFARLTYEIRYL